MGNELDRSVFDTIEEEEENRRKIEEANEKRKIDEDYEYSRQKIKEILEESEAVLDHARDIATETGEPRAIEAYSQLMKNMGDLAKGVMGNSTEKSKAERNRKAITSSYNSGSGDSPDDGRAVFVGSLNDLHEMIKNEERNASTKSVEGEVIENDG